MPIRFTQDRTFRATCTDAGGETFEAKFRVVGDDDIDRVFGAGSAAVPREAEKAFLREAVVSLWDLLDQDGNQMLFTSQLLEDVIGMADLRAALMTAYAQGLTKAKAGN